MIVIKVDSNGNVTTVPAVVHMGESMVEAVIYSDAYHSLCTMRILPPNQEQVEEVICTPIIDDTQKRVSAWKATLPDFILAQSGLCNYQLLFTNLNGKQEVSEQGTFKISGNVPYNAPATVEDFSQYTISELYALLDTFIATYEGLSQQIAMLGGDFSDIEKISQVVHPALLITPTEIAEIAMREQGTTAWWNLMSVNGDKNTVRFTSTQLDPFLYVAKDGFTISGQVLKTSKKFVVKYKTSDTSMTGGSFRFDFTDGSKAFKSVEYINDGEWHLLTFDFYDIVPESASSGVLSGIYWEWASLAVTAGVNIEIAYVGFFDGEIVDLIESMVGDAPSGSGGGGMEIVTVSGTTPSMSSQEIYEKYREGTMISLSYGLPNGNFVLMDLESASETVATFKHTEVDPESLKAKTYIATVFGGMCQISADEASGGGNSGGGGSLPLSGKTVILFGEDFEYYPQVADYITEITGATVINAGIAGSTISACHSDAYENAFSGDSLIRAYCYKKWNSSSFSAQDEALASDAFPSGLNKTRCQAVVDALKAHGGGEITILVSFGKNDLVAGASLKNESSTSDSSTIYGAFSLVNGAYSLSYYNSITCCSPVWAYYKDPLATQKTAFEEKVNSVTGTSGADVITTIKEVADDINVPFVDLLNVGFSLSNELSLGATVGRYNWAYASRTSISWNIARIIARELI